MFRKEGNHDVWIYEKLRKKEIAGRKKHGWKIVR